MHSFSSLPPIKSPPPPPISSYYGWAQQPGPKGGRRHNGERKKTGAHYYHCQRPPILQYVKTTCAKGHCLWQEGGIVRINTWERMGWGAVNENKSYFHFASSKLTIALMREKSIRKLVYKLQAPFFAQQTQKKKKAHSISHSSFRAVTRLHSKTVTIQCPILLVTSVL